MYSYTIVQWLLFFYCYCFIGWCIESCIVSFTQRRWVNRGFIHGPLLPIYGSGAIMVLVCTIPVKEHMALVYLFGMIGATILEYITGFAMEKILKVRYWDYSNEFLNLNGHICLKSSLFWGVLSIFMIYVVHRPIEKTILSIPTMVEFLLTIGITIAFAIDFYYSAKTALDLAKLLKKIQEIRNELESIAVLVKDEAVGNLKERSAEALEALVEKSHGTVQAIKEKQAMAKEGKEQFLRLQEQKREELAFRMKALQSEKNELLKRIGMERIRLIRRYPSAMSVSFKGAFDEVKATIEDKLKERNHRKEKEHEES